MRNKSLYSVPGRQGLSLYLVGRALPVDRTHANTPTQPQSHTRIVWFCRMKSMCWCLTFVNLFQFVGEKKKRLTQSWLTINTQPWINEGGHHTMAARHLREQAWVQLVRALPHRTHPDSTYIIHPSFKCLLCCSITPPPAQCGHCNDILIISL